MEMRLALIGFGGVNRALAKLLLDRGQALSSAGHAFKIVAVCDKYLGQVVVADGINLAPLSVVPSESGAFASLAGGSALCDPFDLLARSRADVAVEATFSNPVNGEPALSHCRAAIELGMHVITTNKGPVAFSGRELTSLAAEHGRKFLYEGTVMSGTPVIRLANECLAGDKIKGFRGILNGTANFVLGRIEQGLTMQKSIAEAQALGYAEANPDADLKGWDVALKVTILANALMGMSLTPRDITCEGISGLSEETIREALQRGSRWKLIGQAMRASDGAIVASVLPQLLPADHPLSGISGPTNALTFETDLLGSVTISGPGAGKFETAYAILSDLLHLK